MHTPKITCKNCGNHFHGRFCNECGEKVYGPKDKTVASIAGEAVHFITHFDGSFFTTVRTFFTRPGNMSAEYAGGIRKRYFKPVSFFLLIVVTYFLFPRFHGLNYQFSYYVSKMGNTRGYAVPIARQKMISHHYTEQELSTRYDKTSPAIGKISLLLLIPLCACVFALLFFTSHRFFFDHFILATEIMSFYIFFSFLFTPFLAWFIDHIIPQWSYFFSDETRTGDIFLAATGAGSLLLFTTAAFKKFYKQPLWLSLIKAVVFIFVFALCIRYVYNLLLYLIVMLFV